MQLLSCLNFVLFINSVDKARASQRHVLRWHFCQLL